MKATTHLLAIFFLLSAIPTHASTTVTDTGHCSYSHNGRRVFDQNCTISGGTLSVNGPLWYSVEFTPSSKLYVEIPLDNSKVGTVNGFPASVEDLGSEWRLTVRGSERATDVEIYQFKAIEM